MRLVFWVALATFALDQITKYIVVHAMNLAEVLVIDTWAPILNLRMAWNYGINFGLLSGDQESTKWILIAIAVMISVWVIWWMRRETRIMAQVSAGLLVGGAVGNILDRLIYGAVADFLNMSCCGFDNPYAFNIADITIFVGAFGLILFTGEKKNA